MSADLMRELHEANSHFHKTKQLVEQAMADTEPSHQHHIEKAQEQMRDAERQVEDVNRKIHEGLKPPPAG